MPALVGAPPALAAVVAAVDLGLHDVVLEQVAVGVLQVRDQVGHRDAARLHVALETGGLERAREVVAAQEAADQRVVEPREGGGVERAQPARGQLAAGRLLVRDLGGRAARLVVEHRVEGVRPRWGQGEADPADGGPGGEAAPAAARSRPSPWTSRRRCPGRSPGSSTRSARAPRWRRRARPDGTRPARRRSRPCARPRRARGPRSALRRGSCKGHARRFRYRGARPPPRTRPADRAGPPGRGRCGGSR